MSQPIVLGVERIFESGRDLELHRTRAEALHEVLDQAAEISVLTWGNTDDTNPHEYVEVAVAFGGAVSLMLPLAKAVAQKLFEKAIDRGTSEAVGWLFGKLHPKQDSREIGEMSMKLADGTCIRFPPGLPVTITMKDGVPETITVGR